MQNWEPVDQQGTNSFNNAVAQTLSSFTAPLDSAGACLARVIARRVSDGAAKELFLEYGFKRVADGDVEVFGLNVLSTKGPALDLIALAAVAATIDGLGSDVRVRVTGLANTEIDWTVRLTGESVAHLEE